MMILKSFKHFGICVNALPMYAISHVHFSEGYAAITFLAINVTKCRKKFKLFFAHAYYNFLGISRIRAITEATVLTTLTGSLCLDRNVSFVKEIIFIEFTNEDNDRTK